MGLGMPEESMIKRMMVFPRLRVKVVIADRRCHGSEP
jgi:hypothetical protein